MYRLISIVTLLFMLTVSVEISYSGQMGQSSGFVVHKRFSGTFGELDSDGTRFSVMKVINDRQTKMVFAVKDNTKVISGTEEKFLSDLKGGDKVTIIYVKSEDSFVAEKIIIEK